MTAEVRPRLNWEAVDLGFAMGRRWWPRLVLAWTLAALPALVAAALLLPGHPWWALALVWWGKPLYERGPLHVLSRALFGHLPPAGELARAMPGLLWRQALGALTVFRVDPARSFNRPVAQLEGGSPRDRTARLRTLQRTAHGAASALTLACLAFELILWAGLLALAWLLVPGGVLGLESGSLLDELSATTRGWIMVLAAWAAMAAVAPFYVAGGFALYLNRRSRLEGWDLELAFRRLASRIAGLRRPAAVVLAAALVLPLSPAPAQAEEPHLLPPAEARKIIDEVLADPVFGGTETVTGWYPKKRATGAEEAAGQVDLDWLARLLRALSGAAETLGFLAELVMWLAAAAAAGLLVIWILRHLPRGWRPRRRDKKAAREIPQTLMGLDVRPESLPGDPAAAALALWQAGRAREALSLLYRASLAALVDRHGLRLPASATEGDCLRAVRAMAGRLGADTTDFFAALTRLWQAAAYAHREPAPADMENACGRWPHHFGPQA